MMDLHYGEPTAERDGPRLAWLTRSMLVLGLAGAASCLGLAVWAPAWRLEDSYWIAQLAWQSEGAEAGVLYRPELRAAMFQLALACGMLAGAAWWLARLQARQGTARESAWSLGAPLTVAVVAYIALWWHALRPLLAERNVDSHTYVHVAAALLRGELHLDRALHDTVRIGEWYYAVFPPFPALVVLPIVAVFGVSAKTLLVTPLLGAVTAYASQATLLRWKVAPEPATWCTAGLLFGTALLQVTGRSTDTYLAHCCAVACGMWCWFELTGRCRGWVIGLLLGIAALSRQLTLVMVPFFVLAVAAGGVLSSAESRPRPSFRVVAGRLLSLLLPLALCLGAYGLWNWARAGNALDSGYAALVENGWYKYRQKRFGSFHVAYVPSNLLRLLVLGPGLEFDARSNYLVPKYTGFGSSLTFTSPFLFYALRDLMPRSSVWPGSRFQRAVLWLCILAITAAVLMHKSALGGHQLHGLRYTLDFTPLLFPLAALSIAKVWKGPAGILAKWLIGYSIIAGIVMVDLMPLVIELMRRLPR